MSTEHDIICDDCKEAVWVGSSSGFYGEKIWYGDERLMKPMERFLFAHAGHRLRFVMDHEHEYSYPDEDRPEPSGATQEG